MQLKSSTGAIVLLDKPRLILPLITWLIAGLLSLLALATLLIQPQIKSKYQIAQLLEPSAQNLFQVSGFYQPEHDPQGNLYVWSRPKIAVSFNFQSFRPVQLNLELRSAKVAGGPSAPLQVQINGQTVDQLHLDPDNPDFQIYTLKLKNILYPNFKIDLIPAYFQPNQTDTRLLGIMVKSIELDRSESWSAIQNRLNLIWLWPVLGLLYLGLIWLYYQRKLAVAALGALGVAFSNFVLVLVIMALLAQIGLFDQLISLWMLALLYLAGLSLLVGLATPFGEDTLLLLRLVRPFMLRLPQLVKIAGAWILILLIGAGLLYGRYNWYEANGYYARQAYWASLYFFCLTIPAIYYLILVVFKKQKLAFGLAAFAFFVYTLPFNWLGLSLFRHNQLNQRWNEPGTPPPSALLTWFPQSLAQEKFPGDKSFFLVLGLAVIALIWLILRNQVQFKLLNQRQRIMKLGLFGGIFGVILLQTWLHSSVNSPYTYTGHYELPPQANYWYQCYMFAEGKGAVNCDIPIFTSLNNFFNGLPEPVNTQQIRRSYLHYLGSSFTYFINPYYIFITANTLLWLICVLCTYDYFNRVLHDRRVSLYTAALVAIGNGFIYFVAQPMPYTGNYVIIILSFWAYERIMSGDSKKLGFGRIILFGLVLGLISSVYDIFPVYPTLLLYAFWRKISWWKTILSLAVAYLFYDGFLLLVFNGLGLKEENINLDYATKPMEHILSLVVNFRFGEMYNLLVELPKSYLQSLTYAFLLITLVLGLIGGLFRSSSREKFLFGFLFLPSALLYIYLYLGNLQWAGFLFAEIPRLSYIAYPAIYLGVALLLAKLTEIGQSYTRLQRFASSLPWLVIGLIFLWHNLDIFGYPSLYFHFYFPFQRDWLLNG